MSSGNSQVAVDVDQLLDQYRQKRSKVIFLVVGMMLVALGVLGAFYTIYTSQEKLGGAVQSAVQMAELTVKSGYCDTTRPDPACAKAREILANPERAQIEGQNSDQGLVGGYVDGDMRINIDNVPVNPAGEIISLLSSIAVIWRVQLNTSALPLEGRKQWKQLTTT